MRSIVGPMNSSGLLKKGRQTLLSSVSKLPWTRSTGARLSKIIKTTTPRLGGSQGITRIYRVEEIDGFGNPLTPDDGRMFDDEIDQLRNMAVFESISLGDPDAGLTVRRIPDGPEER